MLSLEYYQAEPTTNCPTELIISSESECSEAATRLGGKYVPIYTTRPSKVPNGCFWYEDKVPVPAAIGVYQTEWKIRFNSILDPSKVIPKFDPAHGGICKSRGKVTFLHFYLYKLKNDNAL